MLPAVMDARPTVFATSGNTIMTLRDPYTFDSVRDIDEFFGLAAISPDGRLLVVDHDPLAFRVYDTTTGEVAFEVSHSSEQDLTTNAPDPVAFSPDGTLLATATCVFYGGERDECQRMEVIIWNVEDQRRTEVFTFDLAEGRSYVSVSRIHFNTDSRLMGVIVDDELRFYVTNGTVIYPRIGRCFDFWFTSDGTMVLCDTGIEARFWGAPG